MSKKLAAAHDKPAAAAAVAAVPSAISIEAVKRFLPWLVAVAFFMQALDTTILNTAVPAIAKALAIAPLSMKAVLSNHEPGGVHPHQRLDGGLFWHTPRVCMGHRDVHFGFIALRHFK